MFSLNATLNSENSEYPYPLKFLFPELHRSLKRRASEVEGAVAEVPCTGKRGRPSSAGRVVSVSTGLSSPAPRPASPPPPAPARRLQGKSRAEANNTFSAELPTHSPGKSSEGVARVEAENTRGPLEDGDGADSVPDENEVFDKHEV